MTTRTERTASFTRLSQFAHAAVLATVIAAPAALLQGCFPVVAAGVGTAAVVAADRRQPDVMLGDERIDEMVAERIREAKARQALKGDKKRVFEEGKIR